jgi:hypothetical protein
VRLSAIRHHGGARDDFEIADPREVCQDVVLDAVREEGVLLVGAEVVERQDRDRFLQLARRSAGNEEVTGDDRDEQTERRRTIRRSGFGVAVMPAALTSKAQARMSAMGNPASTRTMTSRAVQTGRVNAGNTVTANWMMSQPTTP